MTALIQSFPTGCAVLCAVLAAILALLCVVHAYQGAVRGTDDDREYD